MDRSRRHQPAEPMASLFKDTRSGIYVVEFYDADRRPAERRVTTGVRDQRPADRLRRFWEAAYAEGRYDPWFGSPPLPGGDHDERARRRHLWPITLTEARTAFLTSRAHRAANTRANYDRVTGWFADHVGGDILIAKVSEAVRVLTFERPSASREFPLTRRPKPCPALHGGALAPT